MIQKQIALLAVLIAAGLLIISNLDISNDETTNSEAEVIDTTSNLGASPNEQTDVWALTDISSRGSQGFQGSGFESNNSPIVGQINSNNQATFGGSSATASSTTPTTSSLFYSN